MSGNENGRGCGQVCTECLDYIWNIFSTIRNIPFRRCFLVFLTQTEDRFIRLLIVFISTILAIVSWFEFRELNSYVAVSYSASFITCTFLTFICQKGRLNKKYSHKRRQPNQSRQSKQVPRHRARQSKFAGQPQAGVWAIARDQRQDFLDAAPESGHVQDAPFDFHHAEELSESSNSLEPASMSSDEPLHRAVPSASGSNLPQSSTAPSTKFTHSTPLNVRKEPLQQVVPSDSGSNLPQSSTESST